MEDNNMKRLIGTADAARILGVTAQAVRNTIKSGKLQARQINGRYYINSKSIGALSSIDVSPAECQNLKKEYQNVADELKRQIVLKREELRFAGYTLQRIQRVSECVEAIMLEYTNGIGERLQLIVMGLLSGKSYSEIAGQLGLTAERVRQLWYKTLRGYICYKGIRGRYDGIITGLTEENAKLKLQIAELRNGKGVADSDIMDVSVTDLPLSIRAINCLRSVGAKTVADVVKTNERQLKRIRNVGKHTIAEIKDLLQQYGLHLAKI